MFEQIKNAILTFLDDYELPTLLILIFIEELGLPLPLPSDVLIAYAGARHGRDPVNALLVIATVSVAVVLGSSVLYEVSKRGGPRVVRLMSKVLHLKPERVEKLQGWFARRGAWGIVLGRLIPGLRIPTTVMAGLAGVPYRTFIPATCFAAVVWSTVFYFAGDAIGRLFEPIAGYIGAEPGRLFGLLVIVSGLAALIFSLPPRWRIPPFLTRRRKGAASVGTRPDEATTKP